MAGTVTVTGSWSDPYIGLPWQERGLTRDGIACWGLCRLVYAEVLDIAVPDYAAKVTSIEERAEVAAVFAEGTMAGPWRSVPEAQVASFDILVFRRAGLDAHVGLVVTPGRMLHITSGQDSAVVDYTDGRWAPRLSGVYRHEAMTEGPRVL
ncbi:NlpC/P60 family protein [Methylobacterium sp. sgz302541]|uniref:NlpC/P60 family protein n=1 Tax=unclassified Methylobacterium TaxID=2615210 RepID=UPI003D33157F